MTCSIIATQHDYLSTRSAPVTRQGVHIAAGNNSAGSPPVSPFSIVPDPFQSAKIFEISLLLDVPIIDELT